MFEPKLEKDFIRGVGNSLEKCLRLVWECDYPCLVNLILLRKIIWSDRWCHSYEVSGSGSQCPNRGWQTGSRGSSLRLLPEFICHVPLWHPSVQTTNILTIYWQFVDNLIYVSLEPYWICVFLDLKQIMLNWCVNLLWCCTNLNWYMVCVNWYALVSVSDLTGKLVGLSMWKKILYLMSVSIFCLFSWHPVCFTGSNWDWLYWESRIWALTWVTN